MVVVAIKITGGHTARGWSCSPATFRPPPHTQGLSRHALVDSAVFPPRLGFWFKGDDHGGGQGRRQGDENAGDAGTDLQRGHRAAQGEIADEVGGWYLSNLSRIVTISRVFSLRTVAARVKQA